MNEHLEKIPGTLYVVSTPIGNLKDITLRALDVLKEVDMIAAEDTRRTRILLQHYGIKGTLESYHDHNKEAKTPLLISRLEAGKDVAVVSDAGTPGVSDPAFYLVREAVKRSLRIVPVPGPSALLAALVVSGLPTDRFVFEGFLPARKGRTRRLEELREEKRTLVFYESPHRLLRTLADLKESLGDRIVCIGRELTKKFEEIMTCPLSRAIELFSEKKIKGEFVLVIQGLTKKEAHYGF